MIGNLMSAEEFFGEKIKGGAADRRPKAAGKKPAQDCLHEIKLKMIMRIYNFSREEAEKVVAQRRGRTTSEPDRVRDRSAMSRRESSSDLISIGDDLISADDLFAD